VPTAADGDAFDVPTRSLSIPARIELRDDMLVWGYQDLDQDKRRPVLSSPQLLADFLELADNSNDAAILTFAKKFGPLELCRRHELPVIHSVRGFSLPEDICRPSRCGNGYGEPLEAWRRLSRTAGAVVRIAANHQEGQVGTAQDWAVLRKSRIKPVYRRYGSAATVNQDRYRLLRFVNAWLAIGGTRLRFDWLRDKPEPVLAGRLFSLLGLQLAAVVAEVQGWVVCSVCFRPFHITTKTKRPRQGEAHACHRPECKRELANRRARRSRRRR
jgi:hypothetical protein